jgi:hypothetical protein
LMHTSCEAGRRFRGTGRTQSQGQRSRSSSGRTRA